VRCRRLSLSFVTVLLHTSGMNSSMLGITTHYKVYSYIPTIIIIFFIIIIIRTHSTSFFPMAVPIPTLSALSFTALLNANTNTNTSSRTTCTFPLHSSIIHIRLSFSFCSKRTSLTCASSSHEDHQQTDSSSTTTVSIAPENDVDHDSGSQSDSDSDTQQEMDWKTDEEFKKFMGNPSIEAAIKLEKKRADRKLKQLDRETNNSNPLLALFNTLVRDNLLREKERLQMAEQTFKALDLNQV